MGRLIREDDVMRMLTGVELNNGTITDAKIELRNVKTAYDVEKVVEEIKRKYCKKCRNILGDVGAEEYCKEQKCEINELCDIARKGGVE